MITSDCMHFFSALYPVALLWSELIQ